jgi:hypothetical protein
MSVCGIIADNGCLFCITESSDSCSSDVNERSLRSEVIKHGVPGNVSCVKFAFKLRNSQFRANSSS